MSTLKAARRTWRAENTYTVHFRDRVNKVQSGGKSPDRKKRVKRHKMKHFQVVVHRVGLKENW